MDRVVVGTNCSGGTFVTPLCDYPQAPSPLLWSRKLEGDMVQPESMEPVQIARNKNYI